MAQRHTSSAPRRVLAVHRDPLPPGVAASGQSGWTRVDSCRLGAARIALHRPDWLVLDLRMLGRRELPLLEIARRERVEILALGPVPLGISDSDLEGVELVSAEELVRRLRGPDAPADEAPGDEAAPSPADDEAEWEWSEPGAEPADDRTQPEDATKAPPAAESRAENEPVELSDEDLPDELVREMEEDMDNRPPHSVLTPEELAALLEDRS
jgi:hypothetical protein